MVLSSSASLATSALHLHQAANNTGTGASMQPAPPAGQFQRLKVEDALSYLDQVCTYYAASLLYCAQTRVSSYRDRFTNVQNS